MLPAFLPPAEIDVADDQVEWRALDFGECGFSGLARRHLPAFFGKNLREKVAGLQVVIDDENLFHRSNACSSAATATPAGSGASPVVSAARVAGSARGQPSRKALPW